MALSGQTGSQAAQSIHSSGFMKSWLSPGLEYIQSTGHTSTHAPSVTSTHALPII